MNKHNMEVTAKMVSGAETGGQKYGYGRWDDVKIPKIGREVTLTLGAYQFYAGEGRELLRMIHEADPAHYPQSLIECLNFDWAGRAWVPNETIRSTIARTIASDLGIKKQVELFCDIQLPAYIKRAEDFGVYDDRAQMMWVEIEHVGGQKAAKRIFTRCAGDYSLDRIMWSLKQDQYDHSNENQAGDQLYWSRHTYCRDCIEKNAADEAAPDFDGVYVKVGD